MYLFICVKPFKYFTIIFGVLKEGEGSLRNEARARGLSDGV